MTFWACDDTLGYAKCLDSGNFPFPELEHGGEEGVRPWAGEWLQESTLHLKKSRESEKCSVMCPDLWT